MTPWAGEGLRDANQPMCLPTMKAEITMGIWNVRTMFETGKASQVASQTDEKI